MKIGIPYVAIVSILMVHRLGTIVVKFTSTRNFYTVIHVMISSMMINVIRWKMTRIMLVCFMVNCTARITFLGES